MKNTNTKNANKGNTTVKNADFITAKEGASHRIPNRKMVYINHLITGDWDKESLKNYLNAHNNLFPYRRSDDWERVGRVVKNTAKPKMTFAIWVQLDNGEWTVEKAKYYAEKDTRAIGTRTQKAKRVPKTATHNKAEYDAKKYARRKAGESIDAESVKASVEIDKATDLDELKKEYARIGKLIEAREKNAQKIADLQRIIANGDALQQKRYEKLAVLLAK